MKITVDYFTLRFLKITAVFCVLSFTVFSQPTYWYGKPKPYKWLVGIGWSAIEDDGRGLCQPFDAAQSWNAEVFPTRLLIDRYLKYNLSAEFSGAYTMYKAGKLINDSINRAGLFLSFDLNCKYSFFRLVGVKWLDPYVSLGIGLTQRTALPQLYTGTINVGLGANFWFYKNFGLQLQTSGKIGIGGAGSSYMQHSASIVYKVVPQKRSYNSFSKKRYGWIQSKQRYKGKRRRTG